MIKINLVREGRAVRGTGAAPVAAAASATGGPKLNNILIVAGLIAGVIAAAAYWFVYNRALTERVALVAQRKGEAEKLESIIRDVENYQKRKDSLQSRIDLINQLKQNQKGPVRIMDQISKDLPDLVWLDTMDIVSGKITMNGRGLNPNAIANFVENIKNDPYFEEPSLNSLTQVSAQPVIYQFAMTFSFSYAPKPPAGTVATDTAATTTTTAGGTSGANP